jgi:hypothetical protein
MKELGEKLSCKSKKTSRGPEAFRNELFVKKEYGEILYFLKIELLLENKNAPKQECKKEWDKSK